MVEARSVPFPPSAALGAQEKLISDTGDKTLLVVHADLL